MNQHKIHKLMIAVVQEQDVNLVMRTIRRLDTPVAYLASTGGYLGRRNATLLIALPEGFEEQVLIALQKACRKRVEYLAIPLEGSPLPLPTPVPVTVGGSSVFTIPVERFEEF